MESCTEPIACAGQSLKLSCGNKVLQGWKLYNYCVDMKTRVRGFWRIRGLGEIVKTTRRGLVGWFYGSFTIACFNFGHIMGRVWWPAASCFRSMSHEYGYPWPIWSIRFVWWRGYRRQSRLLNAIRGNLPQPHDLSRDPWTGDKSCNQSQNREHTPNPVNSSIQSPENDYSYPHTFPETIRSR